MLRQAYLEAKCACNVGIYNPSPVHFANIKEIVRPEIRATDPFSSFKDSLIHDLQILNMGGAMEWIHQTFSVITTQQIDQDQILRVCHLIEETISKELPEFETTYKDASNLRLDEQITARMTFRRSRI